MRNTYILIVSCLLCLYLYIDKINIDKDTLYIFGCNKQDIQQLQFITNISEKYQFITLQPNKINYIRNYLHYKPIVIIPNRNSICFQHNTIQVAIHLRQIADKSTMNQHYDINNHFMHIPFDNNNKKWDKRPLLISFDKTTSNIVDFVISDKKSITSYLKTYTTIYTLEQGIKQRIKTIDNVKTINTSNIHIGVYKNAHKKSIEYYKFLTQRLQNNIKYKILNKGESAKFTIVAQTNHQSISEITKQLLQIIYHGSIPIYIGNNDNIKHILHPQQYKFCQIDPYQIFQCIDYIRDILQFSDGGRKYTQRIHHLKSFKQKSIANLNKQYTLAFQTIIDTL